MLYEFYGQECPHCQKMIKLTTRLMKEHPEIKIERKEVWHNESNMEFIKTCDKDDQCGGVPFYYNEQNQKWLCGEVSYDELKTWAQVV